MTRSDIPNIISVLRILLVWPVVVTLLRGDFELTLLLYTIAGISDGLDGFIAKHFNCVSRLGSILDPLADKLLLVGTFCTLSWLGLVPLWLVGIIIARDLLILSGAVAFYFVIGRFEMAPSLISKLNTFCQLSLGLLVVITQIISVPDSWLVGLSMTVLITTAISGAHYVWVWGYRAWVLSERHRSH